MTTNVRRGGSSMTARGLRILELHREGHCVRVIAQKLRCRPGAVWGLLERQGLQCNPDPNGMFGNRPGVSPVNRGNSRKGMKLGDRDTANMRAVDRLILSGEVDRRIVSYRLIEEGKPDSVILDVTDGTAEELGRFRAEKPKCWLRWK